MNTSTVISIENKGIGKFRAKGENLILKAVRLKTQTDNHDTLLEENTKYMYKGKIEETEGHIFILTDSYNNISTVFIVPVPDCVMPIFRLIDSTVEIKAYGFPIYVGSCAPEDTDRFIRGWYRLLYKPKGLHAMSNTWGDRNGRSRVNDSFIRREIESGADIGLDVVQIDDGWQKGIPDKYDENGLRVFEGDFWDVKKDIFPEGIQPLCGYAKEQGVELGLWFAPHSNGVFSKYERDIQVLKGAYDEWGIKYFKLDMIQLLSIEHSERMLDFLDDIFAFGDDVSVELDVTADARLGYLLCAPYGTIFVENRYTAWSNYYPHRTLRNLWLLSRYIPASKFQFELLNPELCADKYSKDDPLRPELYDIDYIFASVMFSNPLFWMETQFLSDKCRDKLKNIVHLWRMYRDEILNSDVYPIGEEPSGASMTGFVSDSDGIMHLLLFRENTNRESFTFDVGDSAEGEIELICSNSKIEFTQKENTVSVNFSNSASYAWFRIKKK